MAKVKIHFYSNILKSENDKKNKLIHCILNKLINKNLVILKNNKYYKNSNNTEINYTEIDSNLNIILIKNPTRSMHYATSIVYFSQTHYIYIFYIC